MIDRLIPQVPARPRSDERGQGHRVAVGETPSPVELAKAACKSEKAQLGTNTFMLTYSASSASTAMNACVAKRDGRAETDLKNAAKACNAERAADPAAFTKKYGTGATAKPCAPHTGMTPTRR